MNTDEEFSDSDEDANISEFRPVYPFVKKNHHSKYGHMDA